MPVVEELKKRIGNFVYGVDVETLEELVVSELKKAGKKLATAESCTGGMLAKRITDIPGSSAVFETGCVTYANCVKERLLGVPHETLVTYGAVSEQTRARWRKALCVRAVQTSAWVSRALRARTAAQKKSRWALCTLR